MHNTGSWCRGVPAAEDHTRCHSCQLLQGVEVAFHMDSPEHLWDVRKYVKKCFHTITPWALILYFNVVYTKLWPHHPEVATERETPQTRQHFPVFCSFILNLIWTTGNLRLNWCCNWKLLHHKLAGNSSCCDLTCNYISQKCKKCRSLWRCIKMGFQLS